MRSTDGRIFGLPVAFLLIGYALRVFRLGDQNVWWDEALAVWAVRKPFLETTFWTASDVHPPLFFWTLWPWVRLAGQTEFAVRYLTLIWGMVTMALAFALARRVAGRTAGVMALALVAVSPLEVWWSQELRMYMLAAAAGMAATYSAIRWADRPDTGRRWLVAYLVAALAAVHTVYLAGVTVAILNLAVLAMAAARRIDRHRYARWIVAQLLLVALFLPWWLFAAGRMQSWRGASAPASPAFVAELWATLLATGVSTDIGSAATATLVFWVGLAAAAIVAARRRHPLALGWTALALFLILPPLAVWAATQPRSLFYAPAVEARYFVPFAAPVYVLAGALLALAWRRSRPAGLALACAVMLPPLAHVPRHFEPRRLRDELQTMVLAIWTQAEPGDAVVLVSGNRYPIFQYYYDMPWDRDGDPPSYVFPTGNAPSADWRPPVIAIPDRGSDPVDNRALPQDLEEIAASHPRVWLAEVDAHLQDPDGRVEAWLNDHRPRILSEGYGSNALHLYARERRVPEVTRVTSGMPWMRRLGEIRLGGLAWIAGDRVLLPVFALPAHEILPDDPVYLTFFGRVKDDPERVGERIDVSLGSVCMDLLCWSNQWPFMGPGDVADVSTPIWRTYTPELNAPHPMRLRIEPPDSSRLPEGRHLLAIAGGRTQVYLSVRGASRPAWPTRIEADFGFVALSHAGRSRIVLPPGSAITVDLWWLPSGDTWGDSSASRTLPRELAENRPVAFVHLVGPPRLGTGDPVWAGHDGPPSSGLWSDFNLAGQQVYDRHILTLDPGTPPGIYTIEAGLYDPETGVRYPVTGTSADPANRRVILGTVEVR